MKRLTKDERLILQEAVKIKRRIQERFSFEELTHDERDALKAAYPFGGGALPHVHPVLRGLEDRGLVEIVGRDTLDDALLYELTPKGKEVLRTSRIKIPEAQGLNESYVSNWDVGDVVQMNELALDNYGEEYAGMPLTITHVATSVEGHPGFDESSGSALYDFDELPFSLYEWELDWYEL